MSNFFKKNDKKNRKGKNPDTYSGQSSASGSTSSSWNKTLEKINNKTDSMSSQPMDTAVSAGFKDSGKSTSTEKSSPAYEDDEIVFFIKRDGNVAQARVQCSVEIPGALKKAWDYYLDVPNKNGVEIGTECIVARIGKKGLYDIRESKNAG